MADETAKAQAGETQKDATQEDATQASLAARETRNFPEAYWRDASDRVDLINELHARPFLPLRAPARVFYIAFRPDEGAQEDFPSAAHRHLNDLLRHFGVEETANGGNHLVRELRIGRLKWERHTEFISYSFFVEGPSDRLFDLKALLELLPHRWLAMAPGVALSAVFIEIEEAASHEAAEEAIDPRLVRFFTPESLATAWLAGRQAIAMGDFRLDPQGVTRFALIATPEIGPRRLGRISQRLIEMETYRALAMATLPIARQVGGRVTGMDRELTELIARIADDRDQSGEAERLQSLTARSAEIERLIASTAFRFSASRAYSSLVEERMKTIREERVGQRQTFEEFMTRRFRPAIRTCFSTEQRLQALSARAERAANLLRTRVDVALEAQNSKLLASMDRRADLQLRLQETVEGLSVVAISYYAVSLAGYALAPIAKLIDWDTKLLQGLIALPVVALVWFFVSRIRRGALRQRK